ncbi:MAG: MlaA family lipoprotein [Pseudomonadota bacterium]
MRKGKAKLLGWIVAWACLFPPAALAGNDPLEPVNRLTFGFNAYFQASVLDPVTDFYRSNTTPEVRGGIHNFFSNLRESLTIVSSLLEGDAANAGNAAARFVINTFEGLGGVYDTASARGFELRPRDLGQVFCAWGLPAGPYVVLPVLGPSTARDAAALFITLGTSYYLLGNIYIPYRVSDIVETYTHNRDTVRMIDEGAIDVYAVRRSAYEQVRLPECPVNGNGW